MFVCVTNILPLPFSSLSFFSSPAFDADQFYKTLLRTKRLDVLRQIGLSFVVLFCLFFFLSSLIFLSFFHLENILNKKVTHLDGSMKVLFPPHFPYFLNSTHISSLSSLPFLTFPFLSFSSLPDIGV